MVRMTEMSDETPECKGLKVPRSEMGVWVKAQAVRFSRNGCYETPWHVIGVSKLSGPEGTPKGMYVQIGLSERGKVETWRFFHQRNVVQERLTLKLYFIQLKVMA